MATDLARDHLARDLAWLARGVDTATVWTWDDLWEQVRLQSLGPSRPGQAALRAILIEAIDLERRGGRLRTLGESAHSPGFRRRLQTRFASWGRSGRDPAGPPPGTERIDVEEWAIYGRYCRLLGELGARDVEGLRHWAANRFANQPPAGFRDFGRVHLLEPATDPCVRQGLRAFHERAEQLVVTVEYDDDPSPREAYFDADELRETLLEWGFDEEFVAPDPARPEALTWLAQSLFREDLTERSRAIEGLTSLGAPAGNGIALIVSRRVRELQEAGSEPEEILVVVPRLDDDAVQIGETLASWGVPVEVACDRPLAGDPAVSAVRVGMMVPVLGWESARLIRLLRNGNVRPPWDGDGSSKTLSLTADAIRRTHVHRGKKAIRDGLRRLGTDFTDAVAVFDHIAAAIDACHRPGSWIVQSDRLANLARDLGIAPTEGLDEWFLAIDDQGAVFDRLGKLAETWSWEEFAREAESIARDLCLQPKKTGPACVRVTSVAEAEGVSIRHLIVANMAEGTFPNRASVGEDVDPLGGPFGREMARFLRLIASARETLSLVFPTTDESGLELAASGFLEDVRGVFAPEAWAELETRIGRLDPVLPEGLARAPAELRVRAVHLACNEGKFAALDALLRDPEHRTVLAATAKALVLAHWRSRRERFGRFDGQISDPRVRDRVASEFSTDRAILSASHLETFALCPFQFFQKYVLKLEPPEDREELDDDLTARGNLLHRALERLHIQLRDVPAEPGRTLADRVDERIGLAILATMESEPPPSSAIEEGLRTIEAERLRRTGRLYVKQFRKYSQKDGLDSVSRHFEVAFGKPDSEYPALRIGEPPRAVELQGVIDRIDMVDRDGSPMFRVIDYKTGSVPSEKELQSGEKLQLSLYALAAERVILADMHASPLDAAYWGIRKEGFKRMHTMTSASGDVEESWSRFAGDLEDFILALVDRLRHADFPVSPRPHDCTRLCDYRFVCRVAQVKRAGKIWDDLPRLGNPP